MLFPNKPDNKITQSFNDGIVKIYSVTNSAQAGYAPVETLTLKNTLRFNERRIGINRYYEALQNQIRIDRVIRVPRIEISTQDVAIIGATQYRIDLVQTVDDIQPPSYDLTLIKYEQEYAL